MKKKHVRGYKRISHSDYILFDEEIKSVLDTSSNKRNLQIHFGTIGDTCHAFITWDEEIEVPENIRDEFVLEGKTIRCGQCPHYGGNTDNPENAFKCLRQVHTSRRRIDEACLWFYQEVAKGGKLFDGGSMD